MRNNMKLAPEFDARVWMAVITLSLTGMGVWSAVVSYNDTPLKMRQVTTALQTKPQAVRARALANLRGDYAVQTLGEPVTRGRLRDAIDAAEAEVGSAIASVEQAK